VRVRHARVLEARSDQVIEQLGLKQACELCQQLANVEAIRGGS
jgi:hypothetical protein